jgi:hypothetical protein
MSLLLRSKESLQSLRIRQKIEERMTRLEMKMARMNIEGRMKKLEQKLKNQRCTRSRPRFKGSEREANRKSVEN